MLGVDLIAWLQKSLPWLTPVMAGLSRLGDVGFFELAVAAVYWTVSPSVGARLAVLLLVSSGTNAAAKLASGSPRPYWVAGEVTAHAAEASYGLPSGHAQNAAAVWGRLAAVSSRRGVWLAAAGLVVAIGVSRWQLGVHAPVDTLGGFALGVGLLAAALRLEAPLAGWLARRRAATQLLVAAAASLAVVAVGVAAQLSPWAGPPAASWLARAQAVTPGTPLTPQSLAPVARSAGALLGFGAGLVLLERRGGFDASGSLARRALRCLVGLAGAAGVWAGAQLLAAGGDSPAGLVLLYARAAVLAMWVAGLAPVAFSLLGLAPRGPASRRRKPPAIGWLPGVGYGLRRGTAPRRDVGRGSRGRGVR